MSGQSSSSSTSKFLRSFFQKARRSVGSCFSCGGAGDGRPATTKVIKPDGSLMEYYLPIRVRYVLFTTQCLSSVLCDADELSYGRHVQDLDSDHLLRPGNIYFVLPKKCLNHPLTPAEMAALASRANSALAKAAFMESNKKKKKIRSRGSAWKGVRILPVAAEKSDVYERLNEDCVFSGGAQFPVLDHADNTTDDIQNLPAKSEDFDGGQEGDITTEEEFEKLMKEMTERSKNQMKPNFVRIKRFSPTLTTIPEEYQV